MKELPRISTAVDVAYNIDSFDGKTSRWWILGLIPIFGVAEAGPKRDVKQEAQYGLAKSHFRAVFIRALRRRHFSGVTSLRLRNSSRKLVFDLQAFALKHLRLPTTGVAKHLFNISRLREVSCREAASADREDVMLSAVMRPGCNRI